MRLAVHMPPLCRHLVFTTNGLEANYPSAENSDRKRQNVVIDSSAIRRSDARIGAHNWLHIRPRKCGYDELDDVSRSGQPVCCERMVASSRGMSSRSPSRCTCLSTPSRAISWSRKTASGAQSRRTCPGDEMLNERNRFKAGSPNAATTSETRLI